MDPRVNDKNCRPKSIRGVSGVHVNSNEIHGGSHAYSVNNENSLGSNYQYNYYYNNTNYDDKKSTSEISKSLRKENEKKSVLSKRDCNKSSTKGEIQYNKNEGSYENIQIKYLNKKLDDGNERHRNFQLITTRTIIL